MSAFRFGERWSWTKARGPLSHPKTRALPRALKKGSVRTHLVASSVPTEPFRFSTRILTVPCKVPTRPASTRGELWLIKRCWGGGGQGPKTSPPHHYLAEGVGPHDFHGIVHRNLPCLVRCPREPLRGAGKTTHAAKGHRTRTLDHEGHLVLTWK